MKRTSTLILVLLALVSSHVIQTRIGCLTKKKGITHFETLQPAQCDCDCAKYKAKGLHSQRYDTCLNCGHQHDIQPLIIVTKVAQTAASRSNSTVEDPRHALQLLIDQYRSRQ